MPPEPLDGSASGSGSTKSALREDMARLRASIPENERSRLTDLLEETLFALPEIREARSILLFYSFGTEVPTGGMAARIMRAGKTLLFPFLTGSGQMEAAELRPGEALEPSGYGPREPGSRQAFDPEGIDLVIAPGLAFDRRGNRLGYGGGHYDRFLARAGTRAVRVGAAFSLQIVDEVPVEPGDEAVHIVVTEQGSLDVRPVQ